MVGRAPFAVAIGHTVGQSSLSGHGSDPLDLCWSTGHRLVAVVTTDHRDDRAMSTELSTPLAPSRMRA